MSAPESSERNPVHGNQSRYPNAAVSPRPAGLLCFHPLAFPQLNQHLSKVLALEDLEEGCRRIFDAPLDALFPHELAIVYPPGYVLMEFRQHVEVIRDVKAL